MKIGIVGNGSSGKTALGWLQEAKIQTAALWCRNGEKGKPLCEQYHLKQYTDYDKFLQDDSFDTVYIGLVNSLHYAYALQAVQAHKHVIVEKPFVSRYGEALRLIDEAEQNQVMLFEAILSRYSRTYQALIPHLDEIGDLKIIHGNFSQYSRRYDAYQEGKVLPAFDPELSGGALYDINVYNIHFAAGIFGMPSHVQYIANKGFNGIDTSGVLTMDYKGFQSVCIGAKDCASPCGTVLQGTKGYIELPGRPSIIDHASLHLNDSQEPISLDVPEEGSAMANEFLRIQEVIAQQDWNTEAAWLIRTKQVMNILDQARVSAGIRFAADEEPEFTIE